MSTMTIQIPGSIRREVERLAARDGILDNEEIGQPSDIAAILTDQPL